MADDDTKVQPGDGGERLYTRAEMQKMVNAQVQDTIRSKFGDYNDLKAKAADSDRNKDALEKLLDRFGAMEKRLADAARKDLIAEVAEKKGLTRGQAKRLVGDTLEELLADADDLVGSFKGQDGKSENGDGDKSGDGKDGDAAKGSGDGSKGTGDGAGRSGDAGKDGAGDGGRKHSDGKDGGGRKAMPPSGRPIEKLSSGSVPAASGDKSPAELAEDILKSGF